MEIVRECQQFFEFHVPSIQWLTRKNFDINLNKLSPVYSDTTQLNSTQLDVELS